MQFGSSSVVRGRGPGRAPVHLGHLAHDRQAEAGAREPARVG